MCGVYWNGVTVIAPKDDHASAKRGVSSTILLAGKIRNTNEKSNSVSIVVTDSWVNQSGYAGATQLGNFTITTCVPMQYPSAESLQLNL